MDDDNETGSIILVCFCPEFAGDPPTGHKVGEAGCVHASAADVEPHASELDPWKDLGVADDATELLAAWDEALDGGKPCGVKALAGPNPWSEVECDRPPHFETWLHVSVCDDEVEYVWRKPTPAELEFLVLTDEGLVCQFCGWEWTTRGEHSSGCRLAPAETPPNATQG